ncbi:hypothetical protein OGV37_15250 [Citrobacter sp. Cb010]|uniref:hypothetical protein n=1 Tax=unclassified Citrobacter TaxID=2644389 RepID=UPI0015E580AC|nr:MULTISPECIES: hypothetical protein [unclassified Citrobacter]MBA8328704.1 hypothetical protein [Citrobacter freundii]MBA8332810.1 hypothetical protein [Citrobacter freundii]MDM3376220.1 hypothetical protein [Citrobacter sp. Cb010]MDM3459433.1 hypothetical protein [Citrobacter sp. Cb036]QLM87091.1 hypothetical protein HVX13_15030 [Citrobacter freundii]
MTDKSRGKETRISFDPSVMEQLFDLAATRQHGSVHTIIKKAVSEFLTNNPLIPNSEENNNDRSNRK